MGESVQMGAAIARSALNVNDLRCRVKSQNDSTSWRAVGGNLPLVAVRQIRAGLIHPTNQQSGRGLVSTRLTKPVAKV